MLLLGHLRWRQRVARCRHLSIASTDSVRREAVYDPDSHMLPPEISRANDAARLAHSAYPEPIYPWWRIRTHRDAPSPTLGCRTHVTRPGQAAAAKAASAAPQSKPVRILRRSLGEFGMRNKPCPMAEIERRYLPDHPVGTDGSWDHDQQIPCRTARQRARPPRW